VTSGNESEGEPGPVLQLTEAEREILLKACQRYRAGIPAYLKSREEERLALDVLIEKLSRRRS
jgi:hypothetical protein